MEDISEEEAFFLRRSKLTEPKKARKRVQVNIKERGGSTLRRGSIYAHTKTGIRVDLGSNSPRSAWEANLLRVLKAFDVPFKFEEYLFSFPVQRGNKSYLPDIWLPRTKEHIEVKGYLDKASQIKLRRFSLYFPEEFEKLTMVISKYNKAAHVFCDEIKVPCVLHYEEIRRLYKDKITNWEGR